MDALGDILAPYSDDIAKIAGGITCLQFLSGIICMNDIRKKRSSDAYPPEPFIGGIVLTVLSLKLGVIMKDEAMIKVNLFGILVNIVFVFIYYWYASELFRTTILSRISIAGVFTMACLAYSNFEEKSKIEFRFGLLITGILIFLVGSPLLQLGEIIKKQSTEGLPFPIILTGTIVSVSWTLYGISIKNAVMTYQNLLLLALSSIQLSLFAFYPSRGNTSEVVEKRSLVKNSKISQKKIISKKDD